MKMEEMHTQIRLTRTPAAKELTACPRRVRSCKGAHAKEEGGGHVSDFISGKQWEGGLLATVPSDTNIDKEAP